VMSLIRSQNQHSPPPPAPLSAKEFWGEATRLETRDRFGKWVEVAELVMVMVSGSVENEHLTCCARRFKGSAWHISIGHFGMAQR